MDSAATPATRPDGPLGHDDQAEAKRLPIASLVRSLEVLEAMADAGGSSSVAELISTTSLERNTVQRILRTLHTADFIQRTGRGEYSVAARGYVLGVMLSKGNHLARVLEPALRTLQQATGEAVHAGVLDGVDVVGIARRPVNRLITFNFPAGARIPAYASTLGRAILAYLPPDQATQVLEGSDRRAGTLTAIGDLQKELDRVRAQGFAAASDEIEKGLTAVAGPVLGPTGEAIAAINVVVPSTYIDDAGSLEHLIDPVLRVSKEASRSLGWKPASPRAESNLET